MRYVLAIPLSVSGRFVASIGFASFRSTREWPDEFIARVKVIGEAMAQALIRKRVQDAAEATRAELSRAGRMNRFGTMTASIATRSTSLWRLSRRILGRRCVGWQTLIPISMRCGQPLSE